nr:ribonuclease H-like domain-containing protein [Tanacetum cinerariifolium]
MVTYLSKSDASEGFNQIIDFLSGSSIKYALTVNPNIYVSCIKQFWTTIVVKKVNDVIRLQALVDKKKVVVTEAIIREALHLDDAEGVECLTNEEIFAELARMGYEKPSTKLTFYKAFFLSHTRFACLCWGEWEKVVGLMGEWWEVAGVKGSEMRIEQYLLMTDYSLWEVILNGDSPAPTRVVDGVLQPVAPTTAEKNMLRLLFQLLLLSQQVQSLQAMAKEGIEKHAFVCKSLDHLIKDCDYHEKKMAQPTVRNHAHRVLTQSKPVPITAVRPLTTAVPKFKVTRPRHATPIITKTNSPIRRNITRSPSPKASNSPPIVTAVKALVGNPQHALKDKGVIDSGCSRHMTGNMSYLSDFKELNGGYVAFGGNPKGGKISRKGKIKTGNEDFDDVYFVKELKFNLFSVSQMCDKKNSVLFTDTECLVFLFRLLTK